MRTAWIVLLLFLSTGRLWAEEKPKQPSALELIEQQRRRTLAEHMEYNKLLEQYLQKKTEDIKAITDVKQKEAARKQFMENYRFKKEELRRDLENKLSALHDQELKLQENPLDAENTSDPDYERRKMMEEYYERSKQYRSAHPANPLKDSRSPAGSRRY